MWTRYIERRRTSGHLPCTHPHTSSYQKPSNGGWLGNYHGSSLAWYPLVTCQTILRHWFLTPTHPLAIKVTVVWRIHRGIFRRKDVMQKWGSNIQFGVGWILPLVRKGGSSQIFSSGYPAFNHLVMELKYLHIRFIDTLPPQYHQRALSRMLILWIYIKCKFEMRFHPHSVLLLGRSLGCKK